MCRRKYKGRAHAAMHTAPLLRSDYEPYAPAPVQNATASGAATSAPATDEE